MSYKIYLASDHRGFALKMQFIELLNKKSIELFDFGSNNESSCDYVDFAHLAMQEMLKNLNHNTKGILICGSGVGMSIVANRYRGIRAFVLSSIKKLKLSRFHNDINVLCIGASDFDFKIDEVIHAFLNSKFENDRHLIRIKKIDENLRH